MSRDNVDQVAGVERRCFSHPWSKQLLEEELDNLSASFITAQTLDGTVIGYAGLTVVLDEGYINNVAVLPEYRRCGVASALLDVFVRFASAHNLAFLTLEVRATNESAIALYQKHGFGQVGVRKNYYDDPKEDAILMTRFFDQSDQGVTV
ncbi:MAG: ribosomal protein S18-alanine N-acetyltransferase [Oscillospiraceae bacterium]|nr:ribosomal protein S18-alanine N-acetyltransferase [Oscillospiraceae bacterium]